MARSFSVQDSLSYGWQVTKDNLGLLVAVTLTYLVLTAGPDLVSDQVSQTGKTGLSFGISLAGWILDIIISIGLIKMALRLYEKVKTNYQDLFSADQHFFRYIGVSILVGLGAIVGLVLLIIPGIIWAIRVQFAPILVIDQNLRPIEAIKRSIAMTRGHGLWLFWFGIVVAVVNIVGALLLGIGILIAFPVTFMANVWVYKQLLKAESK